jgi:hypothetical protein
MQTPAFITMTTRDASATSPPVYHASDAVACAVSGLGRVASSCSVAIMPGYDVYVMGISTSTGVNAVTTD